MARNSDGLSRRHLQTLFSVGALASLTDGQLLERFATQPSEAAELAFAAIVERHGPMVYRTCRGILQNDHEAMDAFQATFLVLLGKARILWVNDSLGPWLHRVACRAANRARVAANRRQFHERKAAEFNHAPGQASSDVARALHEEVDRLPNHYRIPVVLCDVEGRSYDEAARHIGCPVGTVRSRLARGRERLRSRLIRRGLAPAAGGLGSAFAAETATTAMPSDLMGSTIQIAGHLLAGGATTAGAVSASVLELTLGVKSLMFINKLKFISASLLAAVGFVAIGAAVRAQQAPDDTRRLAQAQAQPVPLLKGDRSWIRTLPNGGTIEVLGISPHPSGPNTWWNPDGTPLDQPPCDPSDTELQPTADSILRAVAVRVSNLPPDADQHWWLTQSEGGSRGVAMRGGKPIPGVMVQIAKLSKDQATGMIRFEAATGPWQTVMTLYGAPAAKGSAPGLGLSYMSCQAIATKRGTALTVTHNLQNAATQLVAVDRQGKEHPSLVRGGVGANGWFQLAAEFDLNPEEIQEYRLQKRPYEQIMIPNIALNPNKG